MKSSAKKLPGSFAKSQEDEWRQQRFRGAGFPVWYRRNPQACAVCAVYSADPFLQVLHFALYPSQLPFYPHLLPVCPGGFPQIRTHQRRLALAEAYPSLPSLGWLGLRPGALRPLPQGTTISPVASRLPPGATAATLRSAGASATRFLQNLATAPARRLVAPRPLARPHTFL